MPTKPLAAEHAKRYTDDERVEIIRKFWSFGLPLRDFCRIKDPPPFLDMKRILCISETTISGSSRLRDLASINEHNQEELNLIGSTREKLHARLRTIREEVESLINSLRHSRPDK